MTRTKDLPTVLNDVIGDFLFNNVSTAMPAHVANVDKYAEEAVIDVRPSVTRVDKDGFAYTPAVIHDVPVQMCGGGGASITFPVQEGDTALLIFSKRDMSNWLDSEGGDTITVPNTRRVFDMTDAVALVGLGTRNNNFKPSATDVEIKFKDAKISINPVGNVSVVTAADARIEAEGNVTIIGDTIQLNP